MIARGLLKVWVLKLLSEGSKTGYEIIKEMERRIGWQPSPGSIYPLLQMLGEAGVLQPNPTGNKIYWEITPTGRRYLDELWEKRREWLRELGIKEQAVWEAFSDPKHPLRLFPRLARLAREAFIQGKTTEVLRILEETVRKIEELLQEKR